MSDYDSRRDALTHARILLDAEVLPDEAEDVIQSDEIFKDLADATTAVGHADTNEDGSPDRSAVQSIHYDLTTLLARRLSYLIDAHDIEIPDREDRLSVVTEVDQ